MSTETKNYSTQETQHQQFISKDPQFVIHTVHTCTMYNQKMYLRKWQPSGRL